MVLVCTAGLPGRTAVADETELPEEVEVVLKQLISSPKARVAFRHGDIVTSDVEPLTGNAISAAVAMIVPAPFDSFAARFCRDDVLFGGRKVLATGTLTSPVDPAQFKEVLFAAADGDEIDRFLKAKPGLDLNLSEAEIARLHQELAAVDATTAEAAHALSRIYRLLLMIRLRNYAREGIGGIAPYAREDGSSTSPARELRADLTRAVPALKRYRRNGSGAGASQQGVTYHWIKRRLQDRPLFILADQDVFRSARHCLIEQRHFYVGHSYNSLQSITLMLPAGDDTAVFTVNSTSTDQIAGMLGALARPVAQQRLRDALKEGFVSLRAQAAR